MTKTQQEIDQYLDKLLAQAETQIDRAFSLRLRAIQQQVSEMMIKYAAEQPLTYTDLNRFGRWQREMALIAAGVTETYREVIAYMLESIEVQYLQNYLRSAFLYEFEAQSPFNMSVPSLPTIRRMIENPVPQMKLTSIMEQHRNELVSKIQIELTQGMMAGESYFDMAQRVKKATGFSGAKAKRVARTETGRIRSEAREAAAEKGEDVGVDMTKMWNSSLDTRVRTEHRKLDGQRADKDGYFHYMGMKAKGTHQWPTAKMNVNCRCVIVYLVNGQEPELRRARNYEDPEYQRKLAARIDKYMADGLTYIKAEKKAKREIKPPSLVVPYQTFEEWYEKLPMGA